MKQRICPWWKAFLLFLMFLPFQLFGQVNTITGRITDKSDGNPLPGVTIIVKGTTTGTVTDIDGTYSIKASPDQTLVFSYIGYSGIESLVGENLILNISLSSETLALDEIMVIGYGTQKKSDKTGAVAQVKADEMTGGVITDPLQAIQGQVAGVMITKKGGDPNSGFAVKIRGASGFDSNTQPLYVVDGVPGVDPTTISPEDISTFNILKDAASTAIYGSQGSNGVIIITTKSGSSEKSVLQFNVKVSAENAANRLPLLSAAEVRKFASDNGLVFVDGGANTDWQDAIFRTGISTDYNLNYSGGSEKTTYYASGTQSKWTGILKGTQKERSIGKINITQKALNDKLIISSSLSGTFEKNDYEDYGGYGLKDILYQAYSRNPTDPIYNADGSFYQVKREFNYVNPLATISEVQNTRDAKRFYGSMKADLTIFKGLVGTVNLGYTRDDNENQLYEPRESWASTTSGRAKRSYDNRSKKLLESYVTYGKLFNEVHDFNAVIGYSWQETNNDGFGVTATNANSDFMGANNIGSLVQIERDGTSSYRSMSRLIGFFGRAQYNYAGKYYASGSIRRDGSTKFGKNNKWGWFPTAAIGWTINKEGFLQDVDFLSTLKLRASYGVSGNQDIGEYKSRTVIVASGTATDPETGNTVINFPPDWNTNPDLKWEQTAEVNFGLDYGFIKNRISGSLEVYRKKTTDLLGQFTVPVPPNVARITWGNSGSMENKGIELLISAFVIDRSNFKWKTNLNGSHNKQTMLDLGGRATSGVRQEGYISGRGLTGSWVIGIIEGESLGSFYLPVYAGIVGGKMSYKSLNGGYTDNISLAKRQIVGTALPKAEIGWSNYLTFFKRINLDFTFRAMLGNQIFNATRMLFDYPGDFPSLNKLPDAINWYKQGRTSSAQESDLYVENASFLRLDYLALTYSVNTAKINWLTDLKFSVAANNLFILTSYTGIDPETSIDGLNFGIDQYNTYPKTRSFTFGINASF
jgi:TonB-linked SusC/RagA family outer membrane protein